MSVILIVFLDGFIYSNLVFDLILVGSSYLELGRFLEVPGSR